MKQTGDQWRSQFMDYLAGERGYSQHTIRNYAADLDLFNASLAKDLLGGSADDIRQFVLGCWTEAYHRRLQDGGFRQSGVFTSSSLGKGRSLKIRRATSMARKHSKR